MKSPEPNNHEALTLYSIVIPARDEAESLESMLRDLHEILDRNDIPHEIVVVDDGSKDNTWELLQGLKSEIPNINPIQNDGLNGFGRAIIFGLDNVRGDAVTIMMGDTSDDAEDAVKYWKELNQGYDCVFGSRFIKGGAVYDYPKLKFFVNRLANFFLSVLFAIKLNDTTNAFKAYRMEVIDGCRPLISPHFNLTVELPLKAIVRGYSWKVIPITWRNRKAGVAKLKMKEMGSRYLFICLYLWLEKYFSRGDYKKSIFRQQIERRNKTTHQ
jgi:dolichol-phosphate mannosyltransferase